MNKQNFLYQTLVSDLMQQIKNGTYKIGEKLPSIRALHKKLGVSISTVYKTYIELESMGVVEARPKSGYFVKPGPLLNPPAIVKTLPVIREINFSSIVIAVLKDLNNPDMIQLGSSTTSHELLPVKQLTRITRAVNAQKMKSLISYSMADGNPGMKRQLARLFMGTMGNTARHDIIITSGCMEAVTISLMALAEKNDTILIESPAHFGFLKLLKELGLNIVEAPVDPITGIDLNQFEKIVKSEKITACLVMSNFQNPTGALMPEGNKKEFVKTAAEYNVPVIEDNILSELYYGKTRPSSLKKYDIWDNVISCSSFSKTIAPGLRIGWLAAPEKYRKKILSIKSGISISSSNLNQYIITEFLKSGAYDRFMRTLRNKLRKQIFKVAQAVKKYFPEETRVSMPEGGSLLWIQLPCDVNGIELYKTARKKQISIIPGQVCSGSGKFKNYIRLGCGSLFDKNMEQGIKTLGKSMGI